MYNGNEIEKNDGTVESLKNADAQSLEGGDGMNEGLAESVAEALESAEDSGLADTCEIASIEDMVNALGLNEAEAAVYKDIVEDAPVKETYDQAKVHVAGCPYTTCTYTMTSYYCAYTK